MLDQHVAKAQHKGPGIIIYAAYGKGQPHAQCHGKNGTLCKTSGQAAQHARATSSRAMTTGNSASVRPAHTLKVDACASALSSKKVLVQQVHGKVGAAAFKDEKLHGGFAVPRKMLFAGGLAPSL